MLPVCCVIQMAALPTAALAAADVHQPAGRPIAYWSFSDPDVRDATVADKSGRRHNATILRAALVAGRVGDGLELDGHGTGLTVAKLPSGTTQRSVSLWIRKRAGGLRRLIHFDAWNQVGFSNDALFVHTGRVGRADFNMPLAEVPIEANRWTHLAVTWDTRRDRDQVRVYINGELVLQGTLDASAGRALRTSSLRIGHDGQDGEDDQRFVGDVDEVAVYNTVLSDQQIRDYVKRVGKASGKEIAPIKRRVVSQGNNRPKKPYVPRESYTGRRKLIRVGSELGSRLLDSKSIAETNLSSRVKAWQHTGFDGLVFSIASHERNKPGAYWNMTGQWWNLTRRNESEFAPEIAAFRSVRDWGRLTDNFLWSSMAVWQDGSPTQCQDWFDDEDWDVLLHNIALQARVARECGFKGILLDTEQYVGHHARGAWHLPFNYAVYAEESHRLADEDRPRPFSEVTAQVSRRGEQYGRTVSTSFPGIRLFVIPGLYELVPPKQELSECEYALYPAFLDGLLRGLGPQSMVIGGNEMTYDKTRYRDIGRIRERYDIALERHCRVPKSKRPQVTFAAGIWADAGGTWSDVDVEQNARAPDEHQEALRGAFQASGEYAWLYGEKSFFLRAPPTKLMRRYFQANVDAHR